MLKQRIEEDLKKAVISSGFSPIDIVCDIPKNSQFGDYTTNIALQLAKRESAVSNQSSEEIANKIVSNLGDLSYLEKIEIADPGFINFFIKDQVLIENLQKSEDLKIENPRKILIEYGHVNPLKEIHIGHLRTFILGESLARILEGLGNQVFRANYQGDIGLHIAKAIWGIRNLGLPTKELNHEEKADYLGQAYALGNTSYDQDLGIKVEIDQINAKLYQKDPECSEVYKLAREWSLAYFEPIYELLGIKYDRCFFESEVFEEGKKIVLENAGSPREAGKVFEDSDGAVIFPGEKFGLHNRVFITQAGNPTYEGKEIGLAKAEYLAFPYDLSIHVVASEQEGYFEVVFKAIEQMFPNLVGKKYHLSYGLVDLKEGKMSSRTGNVITIDDLVGVISEKVREFTSEPEVVSKVALGAIKYAYLKYSPQPNMIFDLDRSVSLQGDSGPYVQYTYARIQSVLRKSQLEATSKESRPTFEVNSQERQLVVKLMYFPDIVKEASKNYHPNIIAEYLAELARSYNLFYQENRIIGSPSEKLRLKISESVAQVLKKGLYLLGIEAPERM